MIQFHSTRGEGTATDFRQAVLNGLAPDGGLYFPSLIPELKDWRRMAVPELATHFLYPFVQGSLSRAELEVISQRVFDFPFHTKKVHSRVYALELFHGPTLAFKDVGARFLAECLALFSGDRPSVVLVATSGDTGSAVANGFLGVEGVETVILYPRGKVSALQEKQFASLGGNVTALAVEGTFDDCQRMVKAAFGDRALRRTLPLSSANSINIARWLPQAVYYLVAAARFDLPPVFSVPSGNYGNLTAGLLAAASGMPASGWLAASNANDVVPRFLRTGAYLPRPAVPTIANAMDVGSPSNFERLRRLFREYPETLFRTLRGASFDDRQIATAIREVYEGHGYLMDPHGATGWLAIQELVKALPEHAPLVFLETAHPAKFKDVIESETGLSVPLPPRLQAFADHEIIAESLRNSVADFREFLLDRFSV